jgi:hypothetical protein
MLRKQGVAFDPDDVTRLTIAYDAVLHQVGLVDREDGAALMNRRVGSLPLTGGRTVSAAISPLRHRKAEIRFLDPGERPKAVWAS